MEDDLKIMEDDLYMNGSPWVNLTIQPKGPFDHLAWHPWVNLTLVLFVFSLPSPSFPSGPFPGGMELHEQNISQ
jgi:hypothetical protein